MSDQQRAKQLEYFLYHALIGIPDLSAASKIVLLLRDQLLSLKDPDIESEEKRQEDLLSKAQTIRTKASNIYEQCKTINGLVKLLSSLQDAIANPPGQLYLSGNQNETAEFDLKSIPTEAILRAFQILTQLTPQEREILELPAHFQHPLLQESIINLVTRHEDGDEEILDLFRQIYRVSITQSDKKSNDVPLETLRQVEAYISEKFPGNEDRKYIDKIQTSVNRLLLQAGTGQARFLKVDDQDRYIRHYINRPFLDRLTQTVLENNKLKERFPVYLKRISIEPTEPFPLPASETDPQKSPMHNRLLGLQYSPDEKLLNAAIDKAFGQLPSRSVYRVTGYFYIRLNRDHQYSGFSSSVRSLMSRSVEDQTRVDFAVSSTGIGGTNSHITKVINIALLSDISCLKKKYFPIAHDVFIEQDIVDNRVPSPVWSHSLVHLCCNETVAQAMEASKENLRLQLKQDEKKNSYVSICRYEDFNFLDPIGVGNYYDFDTLLSSSQSCLHARLQALSNALDIDPEEYINDLLCRIEQQFIVEKAKTYISGYPFSSFALESYLRNQLFENYDNFDSNSYVVCNAHLIIAETFLDEGSYRKAYPYLEWVRNKYEEMSDTGINWLNNCHEADQIQASENNKSKEEKSRDSSEFQVFSGSILAYYELCKAKYLYTIDWQDERKNKNNDCFLNFDKEITHDEIIFQTWNALDRAEKHLTIRIAKYHVIDEVSQAAFYPYYQLLAKIYLLRAKLFLWFPSSVAPRGASSKPPTQSGDSKKDVRHACTGRLFYLERSRVYAACDGDNELYVICTAHQCLTWLMSHVLVQNNSLDFSGFSVEQDKFLVWAKQLRDHAILQYAEIGQKCYHSIKEKSGLSRKIENYHRQFEDYMIDPIPAIQETVGEPGYKPHEKELTAGILNDENTAVLSLDMTYLAVRRNNIDSDNPKSTQSIYLFGPNACYLFFIRGLYLLCSDMREEFQENSTVLSSSDWEEKLEKCYYLFTYAWAISDDGCTIEQVTGSEDRWKIRRHVNKQDETFLEPHAESVWDLYPYRVTEIADLGKVFAAVCASLRLYTSNDKNARRGEIDWLLQWLHKKPGFEQDNQLRTVLKGQNKYNGHLSDFLRECKNIVENFVEDKQRYQKEISIADLSARRKELVSKIFKLTISI